MSSLSAPVTLEDHAQGPLNAEIALVEYGDYECPFTRLARHGVLALQRDFRDRLLFVFRHFPLAEVHVHARSAAAAAEAAAVQGQFWAMHEYLFEHQMALNPHHLLQYATELRLDADRFERDRSSSEVVRRIDRDLTSGQASGVDSTPMFYVNGIRHAGSYHVDTLRAQIDAELARHRRNL